MRISVSSANIRTEAVDREWKLKAHTFTASVGAHGQCSGGMNTEVLIPGLPLDAARWNSSKRNTRQSRPIHSLAARAQSRRWMKSASTSGRLS